jgi:UDP-N-acetylmuramoyl-L-alanyl-D-glutamate--2,6-diaminopimelate ligase
MKFSELTRWEEIGVRSLLGSADVDLADVSYDSRKVIPGAIFVAIRGEAHDGHAFIATAIDNGARVIVLEDTSALPDEEVENHGLVKVVVVNSRHALAILSEEFFGNPSRQIRLIGVTGTNGKTTVTTLLKQLLESEGEKVGLIGTISNLIGNEIIPTTCTTPESRELSELMRKMIDAGVHTCVMEVSSHALALSRVAALDFDIAVFTNLTQDHLDFHKTMQDYLASKELLFKSLKDTAVAVTNADDDFGEAIVKSTVANVHSYSVQHSEPDGIRGDLFASHVELRLSGTHFNIQKRYSDERSVIETKLVGEFNVENILAAVSALYFGVSGWTLEKLASRIRDVRAARGRFEDILLPNGATAIIDYAHTPDALQNVLETIRAITGPDGLIITIFGCGGNRDKGKRPKMGYIASELSDRVIVTNDNPRNEQPEAIANDIFDGIPSTKIKNAIRVLDRREAIYEGLKWAKAGDIVLIAGKGHEDYQIVAGQKHHFDDREEVIQWAQTR